MISQIQDDEPGADWNLDDPGLYANRELSWMDFNRRVLEEAYDSRNPLLERVRFLSIAAANLDEFYSKRIGWLKRVIQTDPHFRTVDDLTVAEQLALVLQRCREQRSEMDRCWNQVLSPALAEHGARIVPFEELGGDARQKLTDYFTSAILPVLTPLVVDPAHPFPFISGGSISLALTVRDPRSGRERFARVKVPQNRPRVVPVADYQFVLLEDLIESHLHKLFPGVEVTDVRSVRVLRSIEVGESSEESDDLLELMEHELRRRRMAAAVGLEIGGELPPARLQLLLDELELSADDVVYSDSPLALADLSQIASLPMPDLTFVPFMPAIPVAFRTASRRGSLFTAIRRNDLLVHHPYESFDSTTARFVREAAQDPTVLAIKQTMYRTSPDSPVFQSLIDAAGRGKQVAALVELSARFDEANNIEWARRLEEAGVHVAYGNPNLKIHSKICLVVREESPSVTMYAHIGTGNYNSRTAKVYTDLGLFTADPTICNDLVTVFNYLTGLSETLDTNALLVAPASLRSGLEQRVRREIEAARQGRPARVVFQMNALEDHRFTRLLYEAAHAGVKVDLIVRGICRIRPGLEGLSENIRVVSVIGRFLEHARIYRFENGGRPEYFIGSADVMKRNLDERIEVLTPIRQAEHQRRLEQILTALLEDDRQAWTLNDRAWSRDPASTDAGIHATMLARAAIS